MELEERLDLLTTRTTEIYPPYSPEHVFHAINRLSRERPVTWLVLQRAFFAVITLILASMVVFIATTVLPGNAAYAILGHAATPARLHNLEVQLHLTGNVFGRYLRWLGGLVSGNPGNSLVSDQSVVSLVGPRIVNSAVLVAISGTIGTIVGATSGLYAGVKRDRAFDQIASPLALAVTALPEFVVGIVLVALFSTLVWHWLPAVAQYGSGQTIWNQPKNLILPITTLVVVIAPYLFRMTRAVTIECLESDYVEMARLKGVPESQIVRRHVLRNVLAPTIQVVGLNFLYLAGGIVVVEEVFNFPGLGQGLVSAVNSRDLPVVQFTVIVLAVFYVVVNILADVGALVATPRRRYRRA